MKYRDLIQFEPINEVVKFQRLSEEEYRRNLVSTFVFSTAYEKTLIPEICRNLDYTASYDTFGLQIVGNYGTGKSHLMSLFSLIAENEDYLPLVKSEPAKKVLKNIAGKYKIIRFELGSTEELWNLVCHQIDLKLKEFGVNYSIAADKSHDMYYDKLSRMMAHFEDVYPNKGLMIVIDEMLSYLKGRSGSDELNRDLAVIQALGHMSDSTKFRMVFGVQELIYTAAEFQFASNMLNQVSHRYRQIEITSQDVKYVVEKRLLCKTDDQKATIRQHLNKFSTFFTDMHANLEDYVSLFPVNPSFFDNFQQIKIGKSQRDILKTLSHKFETIVDTDVPGDYPGLICYDSYWEDLQTGQMMTFPDVRSVNDKMAIIHQKIDENLTGGRAKRAPLAHRIANACAIKILQDSLERTNGTSAENLVDDLCYLEPGCISRDFLLDTISATAEQIVTATVGQYFEKNNTNQEYHLRIEGGVNYEQKIKDFASTMTSDNKDSHFFNYLVEYLPIGVPQYRREFMIFPHRIDWKSHKTMLDGYIFMGNPNERSTTQPQQNFYIYFMPIFNKAKLQHGTEADSVYVHFDKVSDEMKELISLYAAADALSNSVDSSQKSFYKQYKKTYEDKLEPVFRRDFLQSTEIVYQGEVQTISPAMMNSNSSKEQIISDIASNVLEEYFCQQLPEYPKFTLLRSSLTSDNRSSMLRGARAKIANPTQPNRDGEAILAGLDLLQENALSIEKSSYALSVKKLLEDKGEGQVLNRDEILHRFYKEWESDWRTNDFGIESDLEFLVLSTLVALGKIEIDYPGGKCINAVNLKDIVDLPSNSFYEFSHIRKPRGMDTAAVRELFLGITGVDMTSKLENPEIYPDLVNKAKLIAMESIKLDHELAGGLKLEDVEVVSELEASGIRAKLTSLAGLCDKIPVYASPAKMKNLPWTQEQLHGVLESRKLIESSNKILQFVSDFRSRLSYLSQAEHYMTGEAMKKKVADAKAEVPELVKVINDDNKVNTFKSKLDSLMSEYAEWYIKEYTRMHITAMQDVEKRRIMNSNEKKVCDAICGADHDKGYFAVSAQYVEWCRKMSTLVVAANNVTKEAVLRTPYLGFDPTQFVGKELYKLSDLDKELSDIFKNVDDSLHQILKDETLLANKDVLDASELGLLNRFNTKAEELSPMNAARLVEIVAKLHQGIQKITITQDALRSVLNRPMTPDDTIAAFRKYINSLTVGSKGDNIRIIMK